MRVNSGFAAWIRIGICTAVALAAIALAYIAAFAADKSVHTGIMPLDRGITFGRTLIGGEPHILAILSEDGDRVRAVDLSSQLGHFPTQPLDLFAGASAPEIRSLIEAASKAGRTIEIPKSELIAPLAAKGRHVATAVNYAKHAVEAGEVPRQPFLFPKFAPARAGAASVADTPGGLLDYEIELGVVIDRPIASANDLDDAVVGFVLVTDMTDRDALIRALFPGSAKSDKGVAALTGAKSGPDRMQMAPYLVVPFDRADFEKTVEIQLAVNGEERQRETAGAMSEDVDALVARALRADSVRKFAYRGEPIRLLPRGVLEPGMVLLTGTPSGTAFRAPKPPEDAKNLSVEDIEGHIQAWAKEQHASGDYLKPGDTITASGTHLGEMRIAVVPAPGSVQTD